MPITIETPARRKCAVCHSHVIRDGFYLKNAQGHTSFRCVRHIIELIRRPIPPVIRRPPPPSPPPVGLN